MPARQLRDDVKAPQSSPRIERPEPSYLHPQDAHCSLVASITPATSSPSRNTRCQISRFIKSQRRSPCSTAPARCSSARRQTQAGSKSPRWSARGPSTNSCTSGRSEEHTSELQSPCNLVCRLLLEK